MEQGHWNMARSWTLYISSVIVVHIICCCCTYHLLSLYISSVVVVYIICCRISYVVVLPSICCLWHCCWSSSTATTIAAPSTFTSSRAHKTLLVAGASAFTVSSASTCHQYFKGFCCTREGGPERQPTRFRCNPSPQTWTRQYLLGNERLSPYVSGLICCSFDMLYQSCLGWR